MPGLSILIPTHNRPDLFSRCLNSVLKDLPADVEVIVNNDSNDITEIPHPQVTYFYDKFDNMSQIYQSLLHKASGYYVYFLEDDDYLADGFLQLDLQADMIAGNYYPKYNVNPMEYLKQYTDELYYDRDEFYKQVNLEHLQLSQFIFRRDIIAGFDFPMDNNVHNDINLMMYSLRKCNSIQTHKKVFFYQTKDGGDNVSFSDTAKSVEVTQSMDFMRKYKVVQSMGEQFDDTIFFDWPLTNWCNYKCTYCPVLDDLSTDFKTDNHTTQYKFTLAKLKRVPFQFNMCITGGEPTLHPNIVEILTELCAIENSQDISIFTNNSRPVSFYEPIKAIGSDKITLFASYHPEYATEKFTEKCIALKDTLNFSVHVTISDRSEYWPQTKELIAVLRQHNVKYKPCLLSRTKHYVPNYDAEFFKEFGELLSVTGKNRSGRDFFKDIQVTYTDGSSETLKDYEIEAAGLNRLRGYNCTPKSYQIQMNGNIENTCTSRRVPLQLNQENLVVTEKCPKEQCPSKRLINFYKTK
jgi:organic radical activating enzyme